jgi:ketosteroid isomerase-like protein
VSVFLTTLCWGAPAGDSAEKEVLAAMESLKHAVLHKDGPALERLLANDLTYTHSAGQEQTKAEFIQSITSGKSITEKLEFSGTSVRLYGKTALVKGRVDLWHSPTNIVHMNILHVWEKSPQGWQLVARQATRLAQ